jgi:hypothetical protein
VKTAVEQRIKDTDVKIVIRKNFVVYVVRRRKGKMVMKIYKFFKENLNLWAIWLGFSINFFTDLDPTDYRIWVMCIPTGILVGWMSSK